MKNLVKLLPGFLILFSFCGNPKTSTSVESDNIDIAELNVDDFTGVAPGLVDQEVIISGNVIHVCRHGGQRMFITGSDPEQSVKITTGEDIAEFNIELEGSTVEVRGIVRELIIDEAYLAEWEAEITENADTENQGHQDGLDDHQQQTQQEGDPLATIKNLRDSIATSGKDHLSDYWVEAIEFNVDSVLIQ